MLDYTMRKKIFEMYFIQGVPIKKITKELEISRNTVRRNISEFNKELEEIKLIKDKAVYDQKIIELLEPKKVKRIRKPKAISLEQLNFINEQLKLNNQKIINKKHKYLLSGEDIYDILVDKHDYKGSVQTVRYHIRKMVTRKLIVNNTNQLVGLLLLFIINSLISIIFPRVFGFFTTYTIILQCHIF